MMFTGSLIEDLFATVERAEQAQTDEAEKIDPWLAAAIQENMNYDSKFLGVA